MKNNKVKIVAVVGPTGSGKTKLAVSLAKKFDGVIISADSRQVYRGLDIGTNKEGDPGEWEGLPARLIDGVPQLLIDQVEPEEKFTLYDWLEKAKYTLKHIQRSGKLPIVVGGTGLYVTALLEGYQPGEGRYSQQRQRPGFESLIIMLEVEREVLSRRSDERYQRIFDDLITEVEGLIKSGVSVDWLHNLGLDYRYASLFITGKRNRELAISEFQQASRAYIRRQLTWWRHHGLIEPVKTEQEAKQLVQRFLKNQG